MSNEKKILCPDVDCNTENDSGSETCSKCGLDFGSFFTLDRVFTIREKAAKKAEAEAKAEADKGKPARGRGLAGLMGGKKS